MRIILLFGGTKAEKGENGRWYRMRIDLPTCGFKSCRYCFDGNCTNKVEYNKCEYKMQSIVVRCKDCKYAYYYNEEDCRGFICNGYFKYSDVEPYDFCSYGEMRDN
jgi:hypothetical protein